MPSKPVLAVSIIALAWVLGYLMEPIVFRPFLEIKEPDPKVAKGSDEPDKPRPVPDPTPAVPKFNLAGVSQDQLPPTVVINETSNFKNSETGLTITVDAGRSVKLVGLQGDMVVISPPGMDYTVVMPASSTNLVDQLMALGVEPGQPVTPAPVTPDPVTPAPVAPAPAPVTPAPDPVAPAPAPVTPAPAPVTPAPAPVTPAPAPAPIVAGPQLSDAQIVAAMQNDLKARALKEFTFDEVTEWKAGKPKELDGVTLQTGLVNYTTQTLFGSKTLEAQAFISNGKVLKWIWPKSGITLE